MGGPYESLKPPIDYISYIKPYIAVLYFIVTARVFMAAVSQRKYLVFGAVMFAWLATIGAYYLALKTYFGGHLENSGCEENLDVRGLELTAESGLKAFAYGFNRHFKGKNSDLYESSASAKGRALVYTHRLKLPIVDTVKFKQFRDQNQEWWRRKYCSIGFYRILKHTETHIFEAVNGRRLASFSIGHADCPPE